MNKLFLLGNLSRDPEITMGGADGNLTIAKFDVAVNRNGVKKGETSADFFHCTSFGKQAQFVEKYFKKGMGIFLMGRVQNNNYVNKDGNKVYGFTVIVEQVEFTEKKSKEA